MEYLEAASFEDLSVHQVQKQDWLLGQVVTRCGIFDARRGWSGERRWGIILPHCEVCHG